MTEENKTDTETTPVAFNLEWILRSWLALTMIPIGMIPIKREGDQTPELGFRPEMVIAIETCEIQDDQALTLGPGLRLLMVNEESLDLDEPQAVSLEKGMREILTAYVKQGFLQQVGELVMPVMQKQAGPSRIIRG